MTNKCKHYRRTIYGATSEILATKIFAWQKYERETGDIELEILPLFFNLETENFHRVIRVTTTKTDKTLRANGDLIERVVNQLFAEKK